MRIETNSRNCTERTSGLIWNIPLKKSELERKDKQIHGTIVVDLDGTLTIPGQDYSVDNEAVDTLSQFLQKGGNLIVSTGATVGRTERTLLSPLFTRLDSFVGKEQAKDLINQVYVLPENGSALLIPKGVEKKENELSFKWRRFHELHVPHKEALRQVLEKKLIPDYPGSYVAGDHLSGPDYREYILSLKKVKDTLRLKEYIEEDLKLQNKEMDWSKISVKAARTTIDFVHADSGKTFSIEWILREDSDLGGPVVGFGDLGDEFAKVIPTFNVNKHKPNEFRLRGVPAMDLTGGWSLMEENGYVITGKGIGAKVRNRETDQEMHVLRDGKGEIVYAQRDETGNTIPVNGICGHPIEIKPLTYKKDGKLIEVDDAGKGTAWMIKRLLDIGYFKQR